MRGSSCLGLCLRGSLYNRAYELAASGKHFDCITIVTALIAAGFTDADEALRSEMIRADLRQICRQHWKHDTLNRPTKS